MQDMNHIRGDEIVNGNPEHCINLLQILQQISMMQDDSENQGSGDRPPQSQSSPGKNKSSEPSMQKSSPTKGQSSKKDARNANRIMGLDGEDDDDYDQSASPDK